MVDIYYPDTNTWRCNVSTAPLREKSWTEYTSEKFDQQKSHSLKTVCKNLEGFQEILKASIVKYWNSLSKYEMVLQNLEPVFYSLKLVLKSLQESTGIL